MTAPREWPPANPRQETAAPHPTPLRRYAAEIAQAAQRREGWQPGDPVRGQS